MVKPDATGKGHTGAILDQIIKAGFSIKAMKWTRLTPEQAGPFYAIHKERPFYGELVEFMSSGPIVAAILEKENAVKEFRTLSVLLILQKQKKVPSGKISQHLLVKMLFMAATVTKMQKLKAIFFFQNWKDFKKS